MSLKLALLSSVFCLLSLPFLYLSSCDLVRNILSLMSITMFGSCRSLSRVCERYCSNVAAILWFREKGGYASLIPSLILCLYDIQNSAPILLLYPQALPNIRNGHALLPQDTHATILLDDSFISPELRDAQGLEVGEGARIVGGHLADAVGVV